MAGNPAYPGYAALPGVFDPSSGSALARIENGGYGTCVNCGAQIAPERLEAMPWATLCIDCKRKEERG